MKIKIDFKHLPIVLCQLGKHRWIDEDAFNSMSQHIYKVCGVCLKEKVGYKKRWFSL